MVNFSCKKITFIGIGLIGSSLALALRKNAKIEDITACARKQSTLDTAKKLGIADNVTTSLETAVENADIIVLCTPMGSYTDIIKNINSSLKKGAILTDVGSVKKDALMQISPILRDDIHFVPAHPIAGTENSGPESGFAELFEDKWCILTPEENVEQNALDIIKNMWKAIGANIEIMSAEHHDITLAITSHLPHMCAYTAIKTASDKSTELQQEIIKYSAGGFRDFTRIAASDPVMWRDIMLTNKDAVIKIAEKFISDFSHLKEMIEKEEKEELEDFLTKGRKIRRNL